MIDPKKNYDIICEQERLLVFDHFNYNDAWELGKIIVEMAKERGLKMATQIIINGNIVFRYGCEGSNYSNDLWMTRKAKTVNMMQVSSLHVHYMPLVGQDSICDDWYLKPEEYSMHGGGFPINIKGTGCIGCVCVSGLEQHEDHNLAAEGIARFLGIEPVFVETVK